MKRSLYKISSKQARNTLHNNSISPTDRYTDDVLSLKNRKFGIHLSTWTWDMEWTPNSGLKVWPWTVTLTWVHCLTEANILPKFKENPSRGIGDMEWTRIQGSNPLPWPVTLSRHARVMGSAHCLTKQTFDQSFMKNFQRVQEIWSEQERDRWPSIVTLILSLHRWVLGSTHHLTKAYIWPKINKAVSMAMKWPQNSDLVTLHD